MAEKPIAATRRRKPNKDRDPVIATKKGVNVLERGSQVHVMAEFRSCSIFRPRPNSGVTGKLNPAKASESERRGQDLLFGKAQCATCHQPSYYTDNLMHNVKAERFYKPRLINGAMARRSPIKTFPLRSNQRFAYIFARWQAVDAG